MASNTVRFVSVASLSTRKRHAGRSTRESRRSPEPLTMGRKVGLTLQALSSSYSDSDSSVELIGKQMHSMFGEKSSARIIKSLEQTLKGGVSINRVKVSSAKIDSEQLVGGKYVLLQKGKKQRNILRFTD